MAIRVAHVPAPEILRHHAERRVRLNDDVLDAAAINEVVDVAAAPGDGQRVIDVGHLESQRGRLLRIDVEPELRRVFLAIGPHVRQQLVLGGHEQELVARGRERRMALAEGVLQIKIEALGIAELIHRRRRKRKCHRVLDLHQRAEGAALERLNTQLRAICARSSPAAARSRCRHSARSR